MGKKNRLLMVCLGMMTLGLCAVFGVSWADDDDHGRKRRGHEDHEKAERGKNKHKAKLITATDATFVQTCGACHMPYAPGLLPLASWKNILSHQENHFGEELGIDPNDLAKITLYLEQNAADKRNTELSKKIMRSTGGQMPVRITEVPYIKAKHKKRKLVPDCTSCHK